MKEWELNEKELDKLLCEDAGIEYYDGVRAPRMKLDTVIAKASQKKLMEYLKDNGGHFGVNVEGHGGFYELEWDKFQDICKSLEVK